MTMGEAYGKTYASTRDLVVSSGGLTVNALRLFIWMQPYFRDGNLLQGREAALLSEWLEEREYTGELKAVQVVQFSKAQAAADLFNGHKTEALRQIRRLVSSSVIEPVGKAARGHAQLFVINPNKVTARRVPIEGDNPNTVTSISDPNPNKVTSSENKVTSDGEWGHIDTRIRSHPASVTCDDETHPELYPEVYPEGAAKPPAPRAADGSPRVCLECGVEFEVTNTYKPNRAARLYRCPKCFTEDWRTA